MRHPEAVDRAIAAASSLKNVASRGLYFHDDSENGIAIFYIISFLLFGKHIVGFLYLGLDSYLDPIERADELGGGKEVAGEFVITRGDAPPILDAAEEIFDLMPPPVDALGQ